MIRSSDIVDPDFSVQYERSLASTIREKMADGSLRRSSELVWSEVQCLISSHNIHDETLIIYLCHYEDFAFFLIGVYL